MDNASKNASDMIGSLQMQYNRGRQASITNELVDIITGSLPKSPWFIRRITDVFPRCQRPVTPESSLESGINSVAWCYPVIPRLPNPSINAPSREMGFQRRGPLAA